MTWFNWIKEKVTTVISKTAKVAYDGAVGFIKGGFIGAGKAVLKSTVGNAIGILDDLNQDDKIADLENAKIGLQKSTSLLNGQITDISAGLEEAKGKNLQLGTELSKVKNELTKATGENKEQLKIQKQALNQAIEQINTVKDQLNTAKSALQSQINEQQNQINAANNAINIIGDKQLDETKKREALQRIVEEEKERLENLEQRMNIFSERLEANEQKINEHTQQINSLEQKHNELDKKINEEIKAREDLEQEVNKKEERLKQVEKELEEQQKELKKQSFKNNSNEDKFAKLLKYTSLKEQRKKLLKDLDKYDDLPPTKDILKDLALSKKVKNAEGKEIKLLPLSDKSSWAKHYSQEELAEMGWELIDPEEQGFTFDKDKIGKLIESNFSLASLSIVDAYTRDKLINKLTKDADLLAEVCQELNLQIPQDEEKKEATEKPKEGQTLDAPTNQSLKKPLLEKLKEIPGATAALNFPWWIYLLIVIALYLYLTRNKNKPINNYSLDNQDKPKKIANKQSLLTNNQLLLMLGVVAVIGLGYYYQDKLFPKTDNKKDAENKKSPQTSQGETNYGNVDLSLVSEDIKAQFTRITTQINQQPVSSKSFSKITIDDIDDLTVKELFPGSYKVSGNYYLRLPLSNQTIKLTKEYIDLYKDKLKAEFKSK